MTFFFVIDTWVLAKASKFQNDDSEDLFMLSTNLLATMYMDCHHLVLDDVGDILKEYRPHMGQFVQGWFTTMSRRKSKDGKDKIIYRPKSKLSRLKNLDPDDMKFLETAVNSPDKLVISGDSDLLNLKNDSVLSSYGIKIFGIKEALMAAKVLDP